MKEPISTDILLNIFDHALAGILVFGEEGLIYFVNKTAAHLLNENHFEETYVHQFFPDFRYVQGKEWLSESQETRESLVTLKDGSIIPIEMRVGSLFCKEKFYYIFFRDITLEKQQQKNLHLSNILLDTVTLFLADFIKNQERKTVYEIFQSILRDILTITQGSLGFIAMRSEERYPVIASFPEKHSSLYEKILNEKDVLHFASLKQFLLQAIEDKRGKIGNIEFLEFGGHFNAIAIPLISSERIEGLFFASSLTYEYKIETIQFLLPAFQAMIVIYEALADREEKIKALSHLRESENKLKILVQDLKYNQEELIQAKDVALALNRAKSTFLANMSHEIRTPLNVVTGMTELLMHTSLDEKQTRYVNAISETSEILINIVNQILDLSKIEAGEFTLELGELNLCLIVKSVLALFYPKALSKKLGFELDFDPRLLNTIYLGDSLRIKQILINLIGNSLKFTEKGFVKLRISLVDHRKNKDLILFEVIDTGIGLSEEMKGKIFSPFTQGDTSTTKKYGGTGLGLAICKRLVTMMHGDIQVNSSLEQGARFHFTIPLEIFNHLEVEGCKETALLYIGDPKLSEILHKYLTFFSVELEDAHDEDAFYKALDRKKFDRVFLQMNDPKGLIEKAKKKGTEVILIISPLQQEPTDGVITMELPLYPIDIKNILYKDP